jgi:hypothetical protein
VEQSRPDLDSVCLRATKIKVDTTVVPADVAYPTDSGLARAINRIATTGGGSGPPVARQEPDCATGHVLPTAKRMISTRSSAPATPRRKTGRWRWCEARTSSSRSSPRPPPPRPNTSSPTRNEPSAPPDGKPPTPPTSEPKTPLGGNRARLVRAVNDLTDCWTPPAGSRHKRGSGWPAPHWIAPHAGSACATPDARADRERPAREAARVRSQGAGVRQRRRDRPRPRRPTRQPRRRTSPEAGRGTGDQTHWADTTQRHHPSK